MRALLVECLRKDVEQRTSRLQSVQQIIRAVRRQLGGTLDDVAVTSPTGLAAPTCSLERAREAIRRYDWQAAYDLFCPEWSSLPAGDLSSFAEAAWWTGHLDVSTEAWEQAYTLHLSESNGLEAARAALHLSDNYESKLSHALANGWLARADRLLQKEEESPVHGWFLRALIKKDEADARFDDALEHAAVAAISGELTPTTTAVIYCNAISACRALADYRRAGAWPSFWQRLRTRAACPGALSS